MRGSEPGDLVDDIRTVAARLRVSSPGSADDLRAGRLEAHADELEAAAAAPVAAGGEPEDALIEAERQRQIAWNLAHAFAAAAPVGGGEPGDEPLSDEYLAEIRRCVGAEYDKAWPDAIVDIRFLVGEIDRLRAAVGGGVEAEPRPIDSWTGKAILSMLRERMVEATDRTPTSDRKSTGLSLAISHIDALLNADWPPGPSTALKEWAATPAPTPAAAPLEEPPDINCITLPDGSCIGTGCMHDLSPTAPAPVEDPEEQPAERRVVDLMAALEESVAEAKAARLARSEQPAEERCGLCDGTGWIPPHRVEPIPCPDCGGTGLVAPERPAAAAPPAPEGDAGGEG